MMKFRFKGMIQTGFISALLLSGSLYAFANVTAPLNRVAGDVVTAKIYNPSEVTVSGTVNGTPYSLDAHVVQTFPITGDRVDVVPDNDSMGNQLPDPVVDVVQENTGMISSPPLYKTADLENTEQLVGPAGTLEVIAGGDGATIAVGVTGPDGKMIDMKTYSLDPNGMATIDPSTICTVPDNSSVAVSFLQGSGAGTVVTSANNDLLYKNLDERVGDAIGESIVSKWIKSSSSRKGIRVYKDDAKYLIQNHPDVFAEYIYQDPAYKSAFSTLTECKNFILGLVDGVLSNGELYGDYPLKVKKDQVKFIVNDEDANGNTVDYHNLDSKAGRHKDRRKLVINVSEGEEFIKENLWSVVKAHSEYDGLNKSPVAYDSTAKWAKKKPNW